MAKGTVPKAASPRTLPTAAELHENYQRDYARRLKADRVYNGLSHARTAYLLQWVGLPEDKKTPDQREYFNGAYDALEELEKRLKADLDCAAMVESCSYNAWLAAMDREVCS